MITQDYFGNKNSCVDCVRFHLQFTLSYMQHATYERPYTKNSHKVSATQMTMHASKSYQYRRVYNPRQYEDGRHLIMYIYSLAQGKSDIPKMITFQ